MTDDSDELGNISESIIEIERLRSLPRGDRLTFARRCADQAIDHELNGYDAGEPQDRSAASPAVNWWEIVLRIRRLDGDAVGEEVEKAYESWRSKVSPELWEKYCSDSLPEP